MQNRASGAPDAVVAALVYLLASPLAGCSSNALPAAGSVAPNDPAGEPAAARAFGSAALPDASVKKKKATPLVYLAGSFDSSSDVLIYDANAAKGTQSPIGSITTGIDGPQGMATDKNGNLYVANNYANTVTVYAPGQTKPHQTIADGLNGPVDVKVDAFGNVYVANAPAAGGQNYIVKYSQGSQYESGVWLMPAGSLITGIALLNPTVAGETSVFGLSAVQQSSGFWRGGVFACVLKNTNCTSLYGYDMGLTGGIAVARSSTPKKEVGFLAIDKYLGGLYYFRGSTLEARWVTGGTPIFVTMNAKDTAYFVSIDLFNESEVSGAFEFSFPGNKPLVEFQSDALRPTGVAVYPSGDYH
ncbi:MAG TPA: hypothetical protein VGX91_01075 [Candidatus Cybelea sp.]|jgi:hypothetical protein|nr:hypothetical protein [Candidatus Cybelea sp.]